MRRTIFFLMLCLAVFPALAADSPAFPKDLQPLPEPPAPPPGMVDESLEPQVTILKRGEEKVEEYRVSGRLYMIKVTPAHGVPYYLIDQRGDGQFSRQEGLDSGLRVPQWVLIRF